MCLANSLGAWVCNTCHGLGQWIWNDTIVATGMFIAQSFK